MSVLCNPDKSVHHVPDWQLSCGVLRQYSASIQTGTYISFKFFNLLTSLYYFGPLQSADETDEFMKRVKIALCSGWDNFAELYLSSHQNKMGWVFYGYRVLGLGTSESKNTKTTCHRQPLIFMNLI